MEIYKDLIYLRMVSIVLLVFFVAPIVASKCPGVNDNSSMLWH